MTQQSRCQATGSHLVGAGDQSFDLDIHTHLDQTERRQFGRLRHGVRTRELASILLSLATLLLVAVLLAVAAGAQTEQPGENISLESPDSTAVVPRYPNVSPSSQDEWTK